MKILFLTSRFPYPLVTGDRLRAYIQIESLAKEHDVVLVCLGDSVEAAHLEHMRSLCADVFVAPPDRWRRWLRVARALFSRNMPLQVAFFYSGSVNEHVRGLLSRGDFDAVHVHLIRSAEYVRRLPEVVRIIDMCDSLALEYERRSSLQKSPWSPVYRIEAARLHRYERELATDFDRVIMISPIDAASLEGVANVEVLVNSVDTSERTPSAKLPASIMFTGYIGFYSDEMAVMYFHDKVLPLVRKRVPDAHFYVVGAAPSKRVRALSGPNVTVTGFVESIGDHLAGAEVSISPMLVGAGLKNKILEAMAHKIPVVTTTLGNQGVGAIDGESVLIGDTAEEFAERVSSLLLDERLRERVGAAGRRFVVDGFSREAVAARLTQIYERTLPAAARRLRASVVDQHADPRGIES